MCFFKKKNKIKLFVVAPNNELEEFSHIKEIIFLTITATKEESEEYINKRVYLQKKSHYEQWCSLRDLQVTMESWDKYIKLFPDELNKYVILELEYDYKNVATVFRMFNGCVPIGTSYEDPAEAMLILQKMREERGDDITNECN